MDLSFYMIYASFVHISLLVLTSNFQYLSCAMVYLNSDTTNYSWRKKKSSHRFSTKFVFYPKQFSVQKIFEMKLKITIRVMRYFE